MTAFRSQTTGVPAAEAHVPDTARLASASCGQGYRTPGDEAAARSIFSPRARDELVVDERPSRRGVSDLLRKKRSPSAPRGSPRGPQNTPDSELQTFRWGEGYAVLEVIVLRRHQYVLRVSLLLAAAVVAGLVLFLVKV